MPELRQVGGLQNIAKHLGADNEEVDDGDFGGKTAVIAKTEGKFLYSASAAEKIGKGLKQKERDPLELCKKTFKLLVEQKSLKMLDMDVSAFTIGRSTCKVEDYLKRNGSVTDRQLELLFSAIFSLTQDELESKCLLKGKRLTERQIAEIFSADRNTTRKWKTLLQEGTVKQ
jgi:DNA-binding CsgD family transcriptional regulator